MADLGTLIARLTLDTAGFSKGLDGAMGSINGLVRMAGAVETALVGTFAAAAAEGLRFASSLEQLDIGFTTFLGSAEKSAAFLKEMQDFAAATPFQFEDVTKGAQQLMALGFAAEDTLPVLAAVGDWSAALGKGPETINRVIMALGQMRNRGFVGTREMNRLVYAGIDAWRMLSDEVGVSTSEIRGMVESRSVDATVFLKAFMHKTADSVGGMMEKQSQTLLGLFSTLKDKTGIQLANTFAPLVESLKPAIREIADALPAVLSAFDPIVTLIGEIAGTVGDLVGAFNALPAPAQKVLTTLGVIGTLVVTGFSAATLAVAGFGFVIAGVTMAVTALDAALMPVLAGAALLASAAATLLPPLAAITGGLLLLSLEAMALSYVLPAALKAAIPSLGAIQSEIQKVISVFKAVNPSIQQVVSDVEDMISSFVQGVLASSLVTKGILRINQILGSVAIGFGEAQAAVQSFWRGLTQRVDGAEQRIRSFVSESLEIGRAWGELPAEFAGASAALSKLFSSLLGGAYQINQAIPSVIDSISIIFKAFFSETIQSAIKGWDLLMASLKGLSIVETAQRVFLSFMDNLTVAFREAIQTALLWSDEITASLARVFPITAAVIAAFLALKKALASVAGTIVGARTTFIEFWASVTEGVDRSIQAIHLFFNIATSLFSAFFDGVVQGAIGAWDGLMNALIEADGVLGSIRDMFVILGTTIYEAFTADTVLAALQAIWKGFSALIQSAMGALLKMVVGLQPLLEKLGMGDVGRQAMSGILNAQVELAGMSENVGHAVTDALTQMANDLQAAGDAMKKSWSDYGDAVDDLVSEFVAPEEDDPKKSGGAAKSKKNPYIVAIEDINERLAKSMPKAEKAVEAPEKVLKTLSQFDKLDPIARQAAENAEAALQATKDFYGGLVDKLYAGLGKTGATISNAMEGLEQGGVWGALAAVIVDLLAESETMAAITSTLDEAFGRISNAFGKLLGGIHIIVGNALLLVAQLAEGLMPVFEWLSGIFGRLGAVFIPLGYIIQAIVSVIDLAMAPLQAAAPILDRAFEILYTVFQAVAVIILGVVYAIQTVWNFLLQGVINVLSGLATIFEGLEDTIDSLEAMKADTSATSDAINELTSTSYAEALAMAETAVAAEETTEALDTMTASLVNVPAGYKVALARFAAMAPGQSSLYDNFIPAMASGGVVLGPTLALVGEKGPEAVVPLDRMGNMGGGPPIIIQNLTVMTDDPEALLAGIERLARRKAFQKTGNSMALSTPFASGRR